MTKLDFPDTPTTGQLFGSAGTMWRFDGTRWASTAGASGARGAVGYAQITAAQGSFSLAVVDITGLGVTFPTVAGRRYRITGDVWAYSAVAGDGGSLYTYVDGAQRQQSNVYFPVANSSLPVRNEVVITATATGSSFAKLLYGRSSGSGAHTVYASPTIPSFILVEDITYEAGSSAYPAGGGFSYYGDTTPVGKRAGETWYHPSTGAQYVWTGAAWVYYDKVPNISARWTGGAQAYPGTNGALGYNATVWNDGGALSVVAPNNQQWEIGRNGVYFMSSSIIWNTSTVGFLAMWIQRHDGTRYGAMQIPTNTTQGQEYPINAMIRCSAGDRFSTNVYSNSPTGISAVRVDVTMVNTL